MFSIRDYQSEKVKVTVTVSEISRQHVILVYCLAAAHLETICMCTLAGLGRHEAGKQSVLGMRVNPRGEIIEALIKTTIAKVREASADHCPSANVVSSQQQAINSC